MTDFIQLHLLTAYPPANLNRDDTGRPKTAIMGGVQRLRLSSQSLKRAWRTSSELEHRLNGHMGKRTQRLGEEILAYLREREMPDDKALKIARKLADIFGKLKSDADKHPARLEQLAFISPEERKEVFALADRALDGEDIDPKPVDVLRSHDKAADIAMFGRMMADIPEFNREAAVQVSHALTTHKIVVEDDYYTAVDDLKRPSEDAGAGFIGVQEFASGVFYLYICVDRGLLTSNLDEDSALANLALESLVRAATTIAPGGKQNSFAAHARALYVLAERGPQQPRSLAPAFLDPVGTRDQLGESITKLEDFRDRLDAAYGKCSDDFSVMNCSGGTVKGSLDGIVDFVTS